MLLAMLTDSVIGTLPPSSDEVNQTLAGGLPSVIGILAPAVLGVSY